MASPIDELKNRLQFALNERKMKPVELSEKTKIPKSSISQYMSGHAKPSGERVYLISNALNINEAWLLGFDAPMDKSAICSSEKYPAPEITDDFVTFPVIGEIAAGYDRIAIEDWDGDTIDIPLSYLKGRKQSDFFVLRVIGNSMYPLYRENDKVLVLKQTTLNHSGDIGVLLYDDDVATLKKVEYENGEDWLRMVPINPEYEPKMIEGEALEHCRVIGIPKLLIREI